jgi:hypothetical protein
LGLAPDIDCSLAAGASHLLSGELEQKGMKRVAGARLLRVEVLILHVLVCHPTFDLLETMATLAISISNKC